MQRRGFTVFAPRIEVAKTIEPLFRTYIFFLVVEGHWLSANTSYGIVSVIKTGDCPCRVPDREIDALKARANEKGVIVLPPAPPASRRVYKKGERVRVVAYGASFEGIHSGTTRKTREIVLMAVLGSVREVEVARHFVSAVA